VPAETAGESPSSPDEDIALIERSYERWRSEGIDGVLELADEQVEWVPPPQALEPETKRGKQAIRAGYRAYEETFDEFLPEADEILPTGEPGLYLVLARTSVRGRGSGAAVSIEVGHLVTVRDGRLARMQVVIDRNEARRLAGLPAGARSTAPRVRRAGPEDLATVARLLGEFRDWWGKSEPPDQAIEADVRRIHEGGDGEYLIAEDGSGEPVGVAQLRFRWSVWTSAPDCWLEDLYVRESSRGEGIGRTLVDRAMEAARERGAKRIELDVNADNDAALALYAACGFRMEPKPPGRTLFLGRPL
jgi:ribosomal protein S18 acetylase RimI-like enzyme/ketosteroid isomerase-like protein